jgi:hypothetical protein
MTNGIGIPVVLVSGVQLGTVTAVNRQSLMAVGVADFRPHRTEVKVCGTHKGLCPLNDGANRHFLQVGTGILAVSGLRVGLVRFKNGHKEEVVGSIPLKFILPLPSR